LGNEYADKIFADLEKLKSVTRSGLIEEILNTKNGSLVKDFDKSGETTDANHEEKSGTHPSARKLSRNEKGDSPKFSNKDFDLKKKLKHGDDDDLSDGELNDAETAFFNQALNDIKGLSGKSPDILDSGLNIFEVVHMKYHEKFEMLDRKSKLKMKH